MVHSKKKEKKDYLPVRSIFSAEGHGMCTVLHGTILETVYVKILKRMYDSVMKSLKVFNLMYFLKVFTPRVTKIQNNNRQSICFSRHFGAHNMTI